MKLLKPWLCLNFPDESLCINWSCPGGGGAPHALPADCHTLQSYQLQLGQDGDGERHVGSLRAELQVEDQQPQQQAQSEEQLHLHLSPSQVKPLSEQFPHPASPALDASHPDLTVQLLSQQVNISEEIISELWSTSG